MANAAVSGSVPDGDRTYMAQLVAARTGVPQSETQQRVDAFVSSVMNSETKAKQPPMRRARPLPKPQAIWLCHFWSVRSSLVWLPRWAEDCATNILKAASQ
jgi:hypothetical protein